MQQHVQVIMQSIEHWWCFVRSKGEWQSMPGGRMESGRRNAGGPNRSWIKMRLIGEVSTRTWWILRLDLVSFLSLTRNILIVTLRNTGLSCRKERKHAIFKLYFSFLISHSGHAYERRVKRRWWWWRRRRRRRRRGFWMNGSNLEEIL